MNRAITRMLTSLLAWPRSARPTLSLVILTMTLLALGCSTSAQRTDRDTVRATTTDAPTGAHSQARSQAETGPAEATVPSGFPQSFPIYGGAEVAASSKVTGKSGTSYIVTWTTSAGAPAVVAYYAKALPENGYKPTISTAAGNATIFYLEIGELRVVKASGGRTVINANLLLR